MNDLIYRQAAIDALDCINGTEEVLRSLPSAQPEIVRCKDCIKHRKSGLCEGWSRYGTITTRDEGWCAWAERREDGKVKTM